MGTNRVFVSQEAVDAWLTEGQVRLDGEIMTLEPGGPRLLLKTAVRFLAEVGDAEDGPVLVGKVQDLDQLAALAGEHCADSVIIGDNAYQVVEGFVGVPIQEDRMDGPDAAGTEGGDATPRDPALAQLAELLTHPAEAP